MFFSLIFLAPVYEVHQLKVKVYHSPVYDGITKNNQSYYMAVENPVPLCGDIKVEFYNKTKMMKKARKLYTQVPNERTDWHFCLPSNKYTNFDNLISRQGGNSDQNLITVQDTHNGLKMSLWLRPIVWNAINFIKISRVFYFLHFFYLVAKLKDLKFKFILTGYYYY